ncbi:MAG: phage terminase large subunit family protein [Planctomycetaceae bacterium]
MGSFLSLQEMLVRTAEAVRPPERLAVWEAAEKYRHVNNPGSYVGPYDISITPYMKEPMEVLSSLEHTGMIFVGPAQCGKSDTSSNWLTYSAICDPADYMHVDKSQTAARDFYHRRIERLFRDTTELRNRLLPGQKGTSTFTSKFISGMLFTLSWPTVNELSGKPVGRIWLADYDRMDEDIGGEGSAYDLAVNRTKTFGKFEMNAAESSPSRDIEKPK